MSEASTLPVGTTGGDVEAALTSGLTSKKKRPSRSKAAKSRDTVKLTELSQCAAGQVTGLCVDLTYFQHNGLCCGSTQFTCPDDVQTFGAACDYVQALHADDKLPELPAHTAPEMTVLVQCVMGKSQRLLFPYNAAPAEQTATN